MRLLPILLAMPLLAACGSTARVGVLPPDGLRLPVVLITWCDDPPAQVDVTSTGISLHYRVKQPPLPGNEVELDPANPGPLWELEKGVADGARTSNVTPMLDISSIEVTVSSETTAGDSRAPADLGQIDFTVENLAGASAVFVRDEDTNLGEEIPRGEFALDC